MIDLIGAKPVPLATNTIGLALSSRRKKVPSGPSKRRMSRSFILPNTWSVKLPPATWRTCSSSSSSACGALAIEKLRRAPSFSRKSMYWPARNCSRSFAGSLRLHDHHVVGDLLELLHAARQRRTAMSFAAPMVRLSITRSPSGLAWQKSALPCARSASVSTRAW